MRAPDEFRDFRQLVEIQGPFVSTAVLKDTFPQGFDRTEEVADLRNATRLEWEEWRDAPGRHDRWVRFVLTDVLGFNDANLATGQAIPQTMRVRLEEIRESVAPSLLLTTAEDQDLSGNPIPASPIAPILVVPPDEPKRGRAGFTAVDRMIGLLRGIRLPVGLVTDGERWTVVYAPTGEKVTSTATWYAEMWVEEPLTLRAFRSLFGAHRWFSVEPGRTLPKLLEKSVLNQAAVTAQLGRQVRQSIERLVLSLDRKDQDKSRGLLSDIAEKTVYEGCIAVMMRLVFLFFAEERELLPASDPLYADSYAVSTIRAQLREAADHWGEEVLERREDAWSRLLATFRAIYSGVLHDRLHLPAYGGELFDPDRYPFLEGRPEGTSWRDTEASPLPVDNRTVLEMLDALRILRERGAEPRELSFRELDVPDIGHVYESLLDHTAKRARAVTLGLVGADGEEPEVELNDLEEWNNAGTLVAKVSEVTVRTAASLSRLLETTATAEATAMLRTACRDDTTLARVLPFAALVRRDTRGVPIVILKGSLYVTSGADRRSTGTHYTPTSLTEPIVQYTLEPLVYVGPAEGRPRESWELRPASELLKLKVCDMACGSGAFLVAAARYLAARLCEAWEHAVEAHPGVPGITPEGHESVGIPGEELIPTEAEERRAYALRIVAQRCLYGVDKNPLAAEMAKLSLWLLTLAKAKPFTFLDHAIKFGDSLVGMESEFLHREHVPLPVDEKLRRISDVRQSIGFKRATDVTERREQESMLAFVEEQTADLRATADVIIATEMREVMFQDDAFFARRQELEAFADEHLDGLKPFHWCLEFPEVFDGREGFDAFVGNPPFIGGQRISGLLGRKYREYLVMEIAAGKRGSADYCAYFFLRARQLLRPGGCMGCSPLTQSHRETHAKLV